MEEIKAPKKERKFLKALINIAKVLANELVMGIARKFIGKTIDKVGNKKQGLVIAFLLVAGISYASIDSIPYPITGNKQRLGFQTSGNGLVWRGLVSDTVTKPTSYVDKNVKAYLVLDSVTGSIYVWKQGAWASLVGGGSFTQPVDSLFFDTSVLPNNVDTAKMRWDSELGTVVLGMYDQVPNEIGFKNFWLVKNQTGSTIAKNSLVYASGTLGASGRISVSKFIANGTIDAKYLLGITAHDLTDGEDGYVISFGKIRQVNTDTFADGAILYPSPTVAGVWTDVEPIAPDLDMPIGFCINSSSNNGTIAIRVASGYKLNELHDVAITSPVTNASLYYSGGLWRDTTQALLVSDTATMLLPYLSKADTTSMLLPYFRDGDTSLLNLTNRFNTKLNISDTASMLLNYKNTLNLKLNISDTASMLSNYALKSYADTSGRFYARQDFTNVISSTLTWTQSDTLVTGAVTFIQVYRNGQILLPSQYTIPTNASVVIGATAYKVGENYTVIFPRGGGASSGGGSGSLTSISGGTGIIVNPNPITTTGTVSADLSVLMELTDTTLLNLNTRFSSKLNLSDTAAMLTPYFRDADTTLLNLTNRFNTKLNISDTTNMLSPYFRDGDTSLLNLTNRFALKLNAADTASLSNRIDTKGNGTVTSVATGYGLSGGTITTSGTLLLDSATVFTRIRDSIVDVAIGNDTIKILKQEYQPALTSILTWTITPKFPIQLKAYILVFRNGQLLNNDQYNLTDTNKITIVSTSFKVGANYTVATVSGIGSIGTGVFPNPIYPDAGIALSTGSTWASSITNNSSNWNTAFTDRLKWDGGSTGLVAATGRTSLGGTTVGQSMFTLTNPSAITFPRFNADNSVSALSAANFRSAIGAGTVTSVIVASGTPLSINNNNTVPEISMAAASGSVNGYLSSTDWTTFNGKQNALGFTPANNTININTSSPLQGGGNLTGDRTISILSASQTQSGIVTTSSQLFGGSKVFKNRVTIDSLLFLNTTTDIPTQILGLNTTGGVNSVGRFTLGSGLNITLGGALQADTTFLFTQADTLNLNLTSRFAAKQNTLTNPVTGTGTTNTLPLFTGISTLGNSVIQESSGNIGIGVAPTSNLELAKGKFITLNSSGSPFQDSSGIMLYEVGTKTANDINFGAKIMYNGDSDNFEIKMKNFNGTTLFNPPVSISIPRVTGNVNIGTSLAVTGAITEGGNNVLTNLDTASLSSRIDAKLSATDTASLSTRIDLKLNKTDTASLSSRIDAINSGGNQIAASNNTSQTIGNLSGISNYYLGITSNSTITITLPSPSLNNNKMITIKNTGTGAVNSASSNVQPLKDPAPPNTLVNTSEILVSGGGKWTTMVSNGFEWVKMAGN
jgi:hypothetical protein